MADALPPSAPAPGTPQLAVPMSEDEAGKWTARLDASKKLADAKKDEWSPYVSAYMVRTTTKTEGGDHQVTVPLIYAYTELKKAQLRFQVPEVVLKPRRPEYAATVRAHEGAVNFELRQANADSMLDMVTTDVLICGIAAAKVGYYADIRTRQVPVMGPAMDPMTGLPAGPDPMTGQPPAPVPQMDPLTGQPQMQPEQYVAHECYYGDRLAPENLLVPADFVGADFDSASYLAHRFQLDLETARRTYKLPPDFVPTASKPQETLSSQEQPEGRDALVTRDVEGIEVFYLATVYASAPMVKDAEGKSAPDPTWEPPRVGQYRRLVFLKDQTLPVVHEDCPYQYVDEADGKLKGLLGNPIHVLTLRYLPGSAYPVSDVQAAWCSAEELNVGRSQMINFRDRVMPITAIDRTKADQKLKLALEQGADVKIGKVIGVDGSPAEVIQPVSVAQFPRDNFKFDEITRGDVELAYSMGRNQTGQLNEGEPVTAEEVRASQGATDTRLAYEQVRLLRWWTRYAEKFASLLMMFKDEPGYAEIVGQDGVKALQAWNRTGGDGIASIQGEFLYEARPDAALRLDINQDRQQKLQLYTQLGNDPNVNRTELLTGVVTSYDLDPEKIVVKQLPEKGPEPPRISYSFKGEDFSPIDLKTGQPNPAFPMVLAIAQQGGVKIDQAAIQNAILMGQQAMSAIAAAHLMGQPPVPGQPQTEHGGATTPMQPISKHVADRTAAGGVNSPSAIQ